MAKRGSDRNRCRECGKDLRKVAPRHILQITSDAKTPPNIHVKPLLGRYCGPDCALAACDRGQPAHH